MMKTLQVKSSIDIPCECEGGAECIGAKIGREIDRVLILSALSSK